MLGLPWPAWGETDVLLAMARRTVEASRCPCGCGNDVAEAHALATDGRWQVEVSTCYARKALERFHEQNKALPPGAVVHVRLLAPGESPSDALHMSVEEGRVELARLRALRAV